MSTPIALIARYGRRGPAVAVPLLLAGALAAGCGTASSGGVPGRPVPRTPVPTVSGGRVPAGEPACAGWPARAPSASLPVSFVPVAVERCVDGTQQVPGKGLWSTATLERADSGLAALVSALHRPSASRPPGTVCPALAMVPPAVVLISATGQELIPRLPATGCGLIQSAVLKALAALRWRPVSVRLIAAIPGAGPPAPSGTPPAPSGTR